MNEMIKRRKRLTEPETAFFMRQIVEATKYLHEQLVIHRDLKLGNLFLDRNINIKVGDLGLATKLESPDEKRKTICGTPNYIAPEVIQGDRSTRGHSFEVDVWSMGVIMFTCLVGKPPYEAKDVKATYQRILANEYSFPDDIPISNDGKDLICRMLQSNPAERPSLDEISNHPFFSSHVVPDVLPANATHVAPKWENNDYISGPKTVGASVKPVIPTSSTQRRPFGTRDINVDRVGPDHAAKKPASIESTPIPSMSPMLDVQGAVKNAWCAVVNAATASTSQSGFRVFDENDDRHNNHKDIVSRTASMGIRTHGILPSSCSSPPQEDLATPSSSTESDAYILHRMVDRLTAVLDVVSQRPYSNVSDIPSMVTSNHAGPTNWVARYVDYTSKYGLGYLLSDGRYVAIALV
jgi:serine/threonine protein kinase